MSKQTITIPCELLESLLDQEPCRIDHHGGCQEHGYLSLEPDELCPIYDAKRRLAELRAEAGPRTDARITRSGVISAALSVLLADLAPDDYAMKDADQELAEENLDQATQEHVTALRGSS